MQYQDPRAAEARRLRTEDGLTSKEIRERLGVGKSKLQYWLAGLPTSEGLRPNARDDLKTEARRLRAEEGLTYPEISARLGVSKSSVSLWVRDVARDKVPSPTYSPQAVERRAERLRQRLEARAADRIARQAELRNEIEPLDEQTLLVSGAIAYWCEGAKVKPWRHNDVQVVFTNTDPDLIRLFLRFLDAVPVPHGGAAWYLHIHESADELKAKAFWCRELGVSMNDFMPTLWKRHNPKTVRKNTQEGYNGCMVVKVRKGAQLYWYIEDLAKAAMKAMSNAGNDWQQVA